MATSLTLLTPNANNPTSKSFQEEAKPAPELVKSNRGKKPAGKGPHQKKQPQRGMGVAQLERLRIQERWKKMTATTTTQFASDPIGTSNTVPVLQGVANYSVPMTINGGNGGLWGWVSDTSGMMRQRVNVGNGGFGWLNGSFQVDSGTGSGVGVVEASKELSSMPNSQYCKPDYCNICFKKKRYNREKVKFDRAFNQFGQVLPIKGTDGLNLENNRNIKEEMNGSTSRAARSAAPYARQININETVEVLAIHRKGNTMGTGSVLMEYEFFPGKSTRGASFKEWEILPSKSSVAVGDEASCANASNYVDLSLKLSY